MGWLLVWLGSWVDALPVFERDFVVDDASIQHRHTKQRFLPLFFLAYRRLIRYLESMVFYLEASRYTCH